jgi:hypothetical protein
MTLLLEELKVLFLSSGIFKCRFVLIYRCIWCGDFFFFCHNFLVLLLSIELDSVKIKVFKKSFYQMGMVEMTRLYAF